MGIIKIYNFKDKVKTWVNKRPAFQSSTKVTKINIKLKSFDLHELNEASKAIMTIVTDAGAVLSGPIPLPMKKKIYCVLRSPHVNKDSREHFEIRTHSRLFEIKHWSPDMVDRLMSYEVPSGVDVQVKL